MAKRKKRKRRAKKKLSPEEKKREKLKRGHRKEIRSVLETIGFERLKSASDKEFAYQGTTSDFDDVYLYENILLLIEYTTSSESSVSEHLKKKKILYDKILKAGGDFIEFCDGQFADFKSQRGETYTPSQFNVVILYCSVNTVKSELKQEVPGPKYLDYHIGKYFKAITAAVKESARYEFLHFLGLDQSDVGPSAISPNSAAHTSYSGSVLPEEHSHFRKGFKVVSFYVDPEALLSRCYVLRKDGWVERSNLYQRMISKKKIESIRRYLLGEKRVFLNNIIVTLPSTTRLLDEKDNQLDISKLNKTAPIRLQLPAHYNSIGLVDGQHRVFSYYEGGEKEPQIKKLRVQQNLLVTGIVYPQNITASEKTKFEATLFLEINANQTNAKSDVKQAIGLLLKPFSPESIAKEIVNHLNEQGPLENEFERYFFEKGKLKTTSVVSYGIRPLVKLQGEDSLYEAWEIRKKERLLAEDDEELLARYIDFCVTEINTFLGAVKASLPPERWTADKKKGGLLTTTNINGFIVCLRRIIQHQRLYKFDYYQKRLTKLSEFNFKKYRSSQYGSMGEELYKLYFS